MRRLLLWLVVPVLLVSLVGPWVLLVYAAGCSAAIWWRRSLVEERRDQEAEAAYWEQIEAYEAVHGKNSWVTDER